MALRNSSSGKSATNSASIDSLDITAIDAALNEIAKQYAEERPEGFTAAEYAKKRKLSIRRAQAHLRDLYLNDYVERTSWKDHEGCCFYIYRMKAV